MIGRYNVVDKNMQALCCAACDAKVFIWNIFFGWRKSWDDNGKEIMEFLLPTRLWKDLLITYRCYFRKEEE